MAELTFIGLANYKPSDINLVNIIFTSNSSDKTTYQYNFSASLALPTSGWTNIPTLTDVTIPAGREISAQLDTPYNNNNTLYYLYIKTSNSINTIWQKSKTTPINPTNEFNLFSNYTDTVESYSTQEGGSIYNNTTTSYTITSNIIYTANTASINITDTYNIANPIFIMSNGHISIVNNLTTTNGSINIVGTRTDDDTAGIHIKYHDYHNAPTTIIYISDNVTLNGNGTGTDGKGVHIISPINITGNVTLNGTARTTGTYGIYIGASITNTSTGNVILNGAGVVGIYINASITNTSIGNVILNGTGTYGIIIDAAITNTSTGNVILNGTGTGGIYIYTGATITNDGSGNVILNGTGTLDGIIIGNNINLKNIILNGTSNGTGINIDSNIIIIGTVIITGTSTGDGSGIDIGNNITASGANKLSLTGISSSSSDGIGVGIYIATTDSITISGNVTLNGKSLNTNGVLIDGDLSITGNVIFIITITNSIVPYIQYNTGTLTGLINIVIDPSSNLAVPVNYNLLKNIPSNNIGIMSGLFNTIRWNIISTSSNNWALVTVESKLVNGDISGGNIVIDNKYYKLSQNGNITFKLILQDVSFILEIQSILVTSSKNGTILYISDNNISTVIATGLYGITTIMQDDNKNIYYTIISQKLFYIYKLGHPKELLQGRGENIQIFYSNGNMILVNTDTNKIFIYKFVTDIKLNGIHTKDVSNLGIITNIINNKGTLLFLFNNNTIYKFNLYSMIQIYYNNINYAGIAVSNNILYGIINNGGILSSVKLLSGSIISLLL